MMEEKYLATCQAFDNTTNPPWDYTGDLANGRAFGAAVTTAADVAYIMGGYNKDDGFLDSMEKLAAAGTWTMEPASSNMAEKKSHFCAVYDNIPVLYYLCPLYRT